MNILLRIADTGTGGNGGVQKKAPEAKIVPFTELPDIFEVQPDVLYGLLKEKGCDAVILGNAA